MKTKILYITFLAGFLTLISCHDDLDVIQPSQITSTSMWTTESDALGAVKGMYTLFRSTFETSLLEYGDLRSGRYGGGMMEDPGFRYLRLNEMTENCNGSDWTGIYQLINLSNLILKHESQISFTKEDTRKEVIANAYFMRAFCYFMVARIWGDAPLLTVGFESDKDDLFPVRTKAANLFNQVELDITEAAKQMPSGVSNIHQVTLGAIKMLETDYYLWKAKKLNGGTDALYAAKDAIDQVLGMSYTFTKNFEDVFGIKNEKNNELIFTINFQKDEYTGGYPSVFLIPEQYVDDKTTMNNPIAAGSHQQYLSITDDYESFLTSVFTDTRIKTSFQTYQQGNTRLRWINKFLGEWTSETRYFSSDLIIYRLAEAYLMKAEVENALNQSSTAVIYLNKIAKRAYGKDNYYSNLTGKDEIDNAIVDEYLKEFVAECKSWWVLTRMGMEFQKIGTLAGKESVKDILYWPISTNATNTNPKLLDPVE